MPRKKLLEYFFSLLLLSATSQIYGVTFNVTLNTDAIPTVNPMTLRGAMQLAALGDTIDCTAIAGQTISLVGPLPPVRFDNITITGNTVATGSPVTIDGSSLYTAFAVASGTNVNINKFIIQNTNSQGGFGGNGYSGGGGGGGGGGALYIHDQASVIVSDCQFSGNKATGGHGGDGTGGSGVGAGGGGGGFGGGNGGSGGATVAGGGGGGHAGGGNAGTNGSAAGVDATQQTYSGGGGAATGGTGGFGGGVPATMGAGPGVGGGGGGGGSGPLATPPVGATAGGTGGDGIPNAAGLRSYGTGGGGGGASTKSGGPGFNTGFGSGGGGGGGDTNSSGGAGGRFGGGGGGAVGIGGNGGIGGGGGGGVTGGTSAFGGGAGASVTASTGGAGGGGGAGLGGAVFVQQGGTLKIQETVTSSFSLQNNTTVAGAAGLGVTPGTAGKNLGNDFFLTSTGSLTLQLLEDFTIASNIESNQCATTGCSASSGLTVIMAANKTLTLSGVNTYTSNTNIVQGILKVNADTGLGATTSSITFPLGSTGILQAGGVITSPSRNIFMTGPGTFDTPTNTSLTFGGSVSGSGTMTKTGPGVLKFTGTNGAYSGIINVQAGTLAVGGTSSTPLGTGQINLTNGTTIQIGADYTSAGTIPNMVMFLSPQTGTTTFDAEGNAKWGGVIKGTAPFIKTGPGTLTLSGANTFIGDVDINAGTLGATMDSALGDASNKIFINNAALQAAGTFTSTRPITLTGSSAIEVLPTFTFTYQGNIGGSGSLTKTNTGTLVLQPMVPTTSNTYLGGTTISGGVLQIFADSALGSASSNLTINTATLQAGANLSLARPVTIGGAAIIDTQGFQVTMSGVMSGSGASVQKLGTGTLILTGNNSYAGTFIITAGTLQGNSLSLRGNIQDNATLIFDQPALLSDGTTTGVYAGVLSGNGTFIKQGAGKVQFTGDSSGFTGPVFVNAGNLAVNGKLGSSNTITVNSGGTLSGTGQVPNVNVTSGGHLSPGALVGILTVNGNATLGAGSIFDANITPNNGGLLNVVGTTTINSSSQVVVIPSTTTSGFYGVKAAYTIIRGPTILGTFGSVTSTNPNFIPSLTYPTIFDQNGNKLFSTVQLNVIITQPFLGFTAGNVNEQAVANNIDALGEAGTLIPDTALFNALETLTGQSTTVINNALDQMHPAQFSCLNEMQNETSAQLLSLFHRRPMLGCYCANPVRLWIEPFGNWLQEKHREIQTGFTSRTQGVALGVDGKVFDKLVLGIGGAWDYSHLSWARGRGKASGGAGYLGIYSDYTTDHYYFGFSFLAGLNQFHAQRHIRFNTTNTTNPNEVVVLDPHLIPVNEFARSHFDQLNLVGQVSTAVMFGPSKCCIFPYLNADVFYSDARSVREQDAPGLNLVVDPISALTLRTETGLGLQVQDTNYLETMCISPKVLLGWAMEAPLYREKYISRFQGQTIPFKVHGWKETWQIFMVDFGLTVTYYCYNFSGAYHVELQPDSHTTLFNQRGSFQFGFTW